MRRASALLAVAALTLGGCAGVVRDRIYYPAASAEQPHWTGRVPQDVRVTTSDGLELRGLYWPPVAPQRDTLVYFHGNAGHLLSDATRAAPLAADGHGVLMTSYRGYSGNPGEPTEAGLARDADAFIAWARAATPPGGRLFLFGHSLGGGVALSAATRHPVDGVATLGTFTSLDAMAPGIARPFMPDHFDNRAAIARVNAPVTLFHGDADDTVPFASAEALRTASGGRARVVVLHGADHHPDPLRLAPMVWNALEQR